MLVFSFFMLRGGIYLGSIVSYLVRNVKLAVKSVRFHFSQYLCFFIALFVIQMLYGIITMASDNNNDIEWDMVQSEYNYHIVMKDLNIDQYLYMLDDKYTVFKRDYIHDIVEVFERTDPGTNEKIYDLYIRFAGNVKDNMAVFRLRYYEEAASLSPSGLRVGQSPLMSFNDNLRANTFKYILFSILLTIVSVFLLMMLYHIRINHYKFTYGIYMSFGADFKKLVETSFWEMMLISLITFIPSVLCSFFINYLIYTSHGLVFTFYASCLIKIFIFSIVIATCAVLWPTWRLSRKTPMSVVLAEDNSNLIVSPWRSFNMLKVKFPNKYEAYSLWRFRKYNVQLILSSVVFTAIFMCALFYTNMYSEELAYEKPQFVINFKNDVSYDAIIREELISIEGIVDIEKSLSSVAPEISSHIKINKKNAAPFSNMVISETEDDIKLTNYIRYSSADEEIVKYLEKYKYVGDLSKILTDDNMIIVSDSYDNTKKFNFKVGDKISIAKYESRKRSVQDYATGNALLKQQLLYFTFSYTEYTICAVLKDNPTFGYMPLYLSPGEYTKLTEKDISYKTANVYIDKTYTIDQVKKLEYDLRGWSDYYDNSVSVTSKHTLSTKNIEINKHNYESYLVIAYLILIISPLMWFFTQILYYQKRENEFKVLQAFGAITSEIKKIHINDGIFDSVAGTIICMLMNFGGIYAIYKFVNVVMPKFGSADIRYSFYMPVIPLVLGLVIAAASGFLSAYIPYILYNKKRNKSTTSGAEFGDDE